MSGDHPGSQPLTSLLMTALNYSEELTRSLDLLRKDNERLQVQHEKLQATSSALSHDDIQREVERLRAENCTLKVRLQEAENGSEAAGQVDQLFKQNAEKQAEIDALKAKVRLLQAKERKWRLSNPGLSSPITSSDDADRMSVKLPLADGFVPATAQPLGEEQGNGSRKRSRPESSCVQSPLRDITPNQADYCDDGQTTSELKFRKLETRGGDALDALAEDGENHDPYVKPLPSDSMGSKAEAGTRRRLQDLLAAPPPVHNQPLGRPASNGSSFRRHQFLPAQLSAAPGLEDDEPFRSRPLARQNLSHFKVDPRSHHGHNYAFSEIVRNHEARKCLPGCIKPECCGTKFKAIAATLPRVLGEGSEESLLLEFMGPGSESKIQGLTPLAKANLVHEARAKRMANNFAKMHRIAFDRPKTPPDFWGVDVLGSQEERDSREQARVLERQEVERRYNDAMKENGRWLFTDE